MDYNRLWRTHNFGGLNFSFFFSTFYYVFFRKQVENKADQFCQLKEKMGLILKENKGQALTNSNL